uniref:Uncharacterized protein n=1 Tax=Corethron hystrix TaxID=216773 RepID=A0A7S1FRK3_9STRA
MIVSAARQHDQFYLDRTILGLKTAGIPPTSVLVFNAEGEGRHTRLEQLRQKLERGWPSNQTYRPVRWIVRPADEIVALEPRWILPRIPKGENYRKAAEDSDGRKLWRRKEAVDFIYLARNALEIFPDREWIVLLQDDAEYARGDRPLEPALARVVRLHEATYNGCVFLNPHGNVAVLFHRVFLRSFIGYAEMRYHLLPIDWLLEEFLASNGSTDGRFTVRLFNHIGLVSTSGTRRDKQY